MKSILDYIKVFKNIETYKGPRPGTMAKAEIPRHLWDNVNTPDLEQSPDSFLRPGETLEDWDTSFRRPNAEGGVQQLVRNTADGSRPGYSGLPEGIGEKIEHGRKYYRFAMGSKKYGTYVQHSLKATPENLKKIVELRNEAVKKIYPNRLIGDDFKKLRLKHKKMPADKFAKFLNSKGYKTQQGLDWSIFTIKGIQRKLDIRGTGTPGVAIKRPMSEIRKIILDSKGGADFLKTHKDENVL